MRRLLLLTLLLAACSPQVVYVVTPAAQSGGGDVLPVEAQRIIDAATATAGAVATQAAYATATDAAARATSTSARQATLDALAGQQTESALGLTQSAGAALATDAAAARTQAAGQTEAWATPTWAALRTQAAAERVGISATATEISVAGERSQAGADGYRNLWGALLAIALVVGLAAGSVAVYWMDQRLKGDQARRNNAAAEAAERERLATDRAVVELDRAKLELLRSVMIERDGQPWVIAPGGRLLPMLPGGVATQAQANRAHEWRWRVAAKKAVYAGIAEGAGKGAPQFGERDLASREHPWIINADGTPSSTGYRQINRLLRGLGLWTTSGRNTTWGPGWDELRFEREFDHLPLPNLPDGEPPDVRIPPRDSADSAVSAVSAVPHAD